MKTNDILHLVLMYKWFDMIANGIKTEEYREINEYWQNRIGKHSYSEVCFHRGYTSTTMFKKILKIEKGVGNMEWGAPKHEVYIIKLG